MKREVIPLETYTQRLQNREPFSLSRWGDGEWAVVLGHTGQNCDGHIYFPDLRDDLRRVLRRARAYEFGFLTVAWRAGKPAIETYLQNAVGPVHWVDGDEMLVRSCLGEFYPFLAQLRRKRVVVVGPQHLRALNSRGVFDYVDFIEVPPINAYLHKGQIERALWQSIKQNRAEVVSFSAGFVTKVIIDDFYPYFPDVSLIDFGSLWDVYCGKTSRLHNRKGPWGRLIPLNLGKGAE